MNLIELQRALRQLRLGGIAAVLEPRLHQAQTERMTPIDLISCLVSDERNRRSDRLLERRRKAAEFRDSQKTLDGTRLRLYTCVGNVLAVDGSAKYPSRGREIGPSGPLPPGWFNDCGCSG
jgi:hypothetical protein